MSPVLQRLPLRHLALESRQPCIYVLLPYTLHLGRWIGRNERGQMQKSSVAGML